MEEVTVADKNEDELIGSLYYYNYKNKPVVTELSERNLSNSFYSEKSQEALKESIIIQDDKEFEEESKEENSHLKIEKKKTMISRIGSPFSNYLYKKSVLNDCMYYPPRLIVALIIGIITASYITYKVLNFSITMDDK
jgi:hypothetical protein